MSKRGVFKEFIVLLSMLILEAYFVFADSSSVPTGPDTLTVSDSSRPTADTIPSIDAEAGNVTALLVTDERTTEAWQAYYGNITGTIVLDDANNVTFYDWALPNPTGEIYAANSSATVTWAKVYCMNLSHKRGVNGTIVYNINMSQIELNFGINNSLGGTADDLDGLNETFNGTYIDATGFKVGSITIDTADGCSYAAMYTDQGPDSNWQELLLTDNSSLIFTSIIRENADMYKTGTEPADFQMLVLENGHTGSEDTTTSYYFYVELA